MFIFTPPFNQHSCCLRVTVFKTYVVRCDKRNLHFTDQHGTRKTLLWRRLANITFIAKKHSLNRINTLGQGSSHRNSIQRMILKIMLKFIVHEIILFVTNNQHLCQRPYYFSYITSKNKQINKTLQKLKKVSQPMCLRKSLELGKNKQIGQTFSSILRTFRPQ